MRGNLTKRGKASWRLKFDTGRDPATGKRLTQFVTFRGTRKAAEAKLTELLGAVDKDSFVVPTKLTVAELLRDRLKQWEGAGDIGAKTAERYRELLDNQIAPHLGGHLVQRLKTLDIESWHRALKEQGLSARTIGHAHRMLGKALKDAARHDLVSKNVASAQGAPKTADEEVVILTAEQVAALPGLLAGRSVYARAMTALFTGVRRGELLALRWGNVDLDGKVIRVRESLEQTSAGIVFKTPKSRAGRRDISLPDIVVDVLRDHRRQVLEQRLALGLGRLQEGDLVFSTLEGAPLNPAAFSGAWQRIATAIGLKGITWHALRHTHASQLIGAGVDVVTISKRMGHASPNITLRTYAHLFSTSDSKASDAINAALAPR